MFQLRDFVNERLSAAAVEIFGEVEKTVALYQVQVTRSRDEVDNLRKQLDLLRDKSAAEPPQANSTVVGEECDPTLLQDPGPSTPLEMGKESNFSLRLEVPGPSQTNADTENKDWSYCTLQTDLEISQIKEEQEELGIDSQEQEAIFPSPDIVKSEQDQPETEFTHELQPLSSDCSAAQSENNDNDEDWVKSKGAAKRTKKRKAKKAQRQSKQGGLKVLPYEDSSVKSQTDRSFCHLCGKAFQYIGSLMKHIKMHDKTVDCGVCGKTCQSTEELISHLQCAHSKNHFCDVCGKTFTKIHFLRLHSKMHTGLKKQFTCQDCGKAFLQKEHLIVHVRTHSGEKPYHCDICGKAFSQSQNLTIHKRSHTGEKPYHCDLCGKLFSTSGHLKIHMRYHSGEKPYSCDICGKHFRQSGQMTRHRRTHTGERPYGCHVCGMRYRFAPNLKAHLKSHERETPS
ncbi:zinc finger protein 436-like [Centroberyx affinis]|uniref:zinc finger protein 436-like n=1 Tax=Centroberyx affinis TaxID=166261 RepID=UPI003A5BB10D